jgi:hypothetical protein
MASHSETGSHPAKACSSGRNRGTALADLATALQHRFFGPVTAGPVAVEGVNGLERQP